MQNNQTARSLAAKIFYDFQKQNFYRDLILENMSEHSLMRIHENFYTSSPLPFAHHLAVSQSGRRGHWWRRWNYLSRESHMRS